MASKWYYEWDGKTFGPFSSAQFRELAAIGRLQPTDMVWKEGASGRVQASQVNRLFPAREIQSVPPRQPIAAVANTAIANAAAANAAPVNAAVTAGLVPPARKSGELGGSSKSKKPSLMPGLEDYQPPAEDLMRGLLPDPDSVTLVPVPELEKPPKRADDEDEDESEEPPPSRSRQASPSRSKHASPPSRSRHAVVKPKDSARQRSTPKDSVRDRSAARDSVRHRSSTKHPGKDR